MVQGPTHRLTIRYHEFKTVQTIEVCWIEYAFHDSVDGDGRNTKRAAAMRCLNYHVSGGLRICIVNQNPENISLFHRTHAWTTREESFHRSWFWSWISRRIARLLNWSTYPG